MHLPFYLIQEAPGVCVPLKSPTLPELILPNTIYLLAEADAEISTMKERNLQRMLIIYTN